MSRSSSESSSSESVTPPLPEFPEEDFLSDTDDDTNPLDVEGVVHTFLTPLNTPPLQRLSRPQTRDRGRRKTREEDDEAYKQERREGEKTEGASYQRLNSRSPENYGTTSNRRSSYNRSSYNEIFEPKKGFWEKPFTWGASLGFFLLLIHVFVTLAVAANKDDPGQVIDDSNIFWKMFALFYVHSSFAGRMIFGYGSEAAVLIGGTSGAFQLFSKPKEKALVQWNSGDAFINLPRDGSQFKVDDFKSGAVATIIKYWGSVVNSSSGAAVSKEEFDCAAANLVQYLKRHCESQDPEVQKRVVHLYKQVTEQWVRTKVSEDARKEKRFSRVMAAPAITTQLISLPQWLNDELSSLARTVKVEPVTLHNMPTPVVNSIETTTKSRSLSPRGADE